MTLCGQIEAITRRGDIPEDAKLHLEKIAHQLEHHARAIQEQSRSIDRVLPESAQRNVVVLTGALREVADAISG